MPNFLCCPRLAVDVYSFALDASDLQSPKLWQHRDLLYNVPHTITPVKVGIKVENTRFRIKFDMNLLVERLALDI